MGEALNDQLIRINITRGWDLIILATEHPPTGCLWQEGPLAPSTSDPKKNSFILSQLGDRIIKGKKRSVKLFGREVTSIVIPFNKDQL